MQNINNFKEYIEQFRQIHNPKNMFVLIDEEVLEALLKGYSAALKAGVAIYYPTEANITSIDSFRYYIPWKKSEELFHPFCKRYRSIESHNKACLRFDKRITMKYYKKDWNGPKLYHCHLGMWDMAYPIEVGGKIVGILFAGQTIATDGNIKWADELKDIKDDVVWDIFSPNKEIPKEGHQAKDIEEIIKGKVEPRYCKDLMKGIDEGLSGRETVDVAELEDRYKRFKEFGEMMQGLLDELYELKFSAAKEDLLKVMAVELVRNTTVPEQWWNGLASVISAFEEATEEGAFDVYSRKQSFYVRKINKSQVVPQGLGKVVPFNVCIDMPMNKLVSIDKLKSDHAREYFGISDGGYLYKYDLGENNEQNISTIVLIHRDIHQDVIYSFVEEFCAMLALRTNVSKLFSQIIQDREEFENRVRRVSHSAKTPLQIAWSSILHAQRFIAQQPKGEKREITMNNLMKARKNILKSKFEMSGFSSEVVRIWKVVNLYDILITLIDEMEPIALKKSCRINLVIDEETIPVKIYEEEMRIALRNLLDNAIKFSFSKQNIRILVTISTFDIVKIEFSNFGIGIPSGKSNVIKNEGERGGVVDVERHDKIRAGSGMGLPIAIDAIYRCKGTFNIESFETRGSQEDKCLRYVTRAIVTLPISGE